MKMQHTGAAGLALLFICCILEGLHSSSAHCPRPHCLHAKKWQLLFKPCADNGRCHYKGHFRPKPHDESSCCPGWKGHLCRIPVCHPPCGLGHVCQSAWSCHCHTGNSHTAVKPHLVGSQKSFDGETRRSHNQKHGSLRNYGTLERTGPLQIHDILRSQNRPMVNLQVKHDSQRSHDGMRSHTQHAGSLRAQANTAPEQKTFSRSHPVSYDHVSSHNHARYKRAVRSWAAWGGWSVCSKTCGTGTRTRKHVCQAGTGTYCPGSETDESSCNPSGCPVDGMWGVWNQWSGCGKTCTPDGDTAPRRIRTHSCNSPAPAFGGNTCDGQSSEDQYCNEHICPVDGAWGIWGAWSECSKSCNKGAKSRTHECDNPAPKAGGAHCSGLTSDERPCNTHPCKETPVGAIAGGVVGGVVVLVLVGLVLFFVLRRQSYEDEKYVIDFTQEEEEEATPMERKKKPMMVSYVNDNDDDDIYVYGNMETSGDASWNTSHNSLTFGKILSSGRYTEVKQATLKEDGVKKLVVAKTLKGNGSSEDKLWMTAKMNFLASAVGKHLNLVNFVGAVQDGPVILQEYCDAGTLKDWLKKQSKVPHLTEKAMGNMNDFCIHIDKGMEHIHDRGLLHKRLGIRNILLTSINGALTAKITGFGPMKGEGESSGNSVKGERQRFPIRWMAPEQLNMDGGKRMYTAGTDVWSYGITVWEIYSLGKHPYPGKTTPEVKRDLMSERYRMDKPEHSQDSMYNEVMMACWEENPDDRPSFLEIRLLLEKILLGIESEENYYAVDMTTNTTIPNQKMAQNGLSQPAAKKWDENVYDNPQDEEFYDDTGNLGKPD